MAKRKTTEEFIEDAKAIHGDKYDYRKTEYINTHTKVCIGEPDCERGIGFLFEDEPFLMKIR